jgi:hypothetical protein
MDNPKGLPVSIQSKCCCQKTEYWIPEGSLSDNQNNISY